jgi:hypothetical protein
MKKTIDEYTGKPPGSFMKFIKEQEKIEGQLYPVKCLVDFRTGLPIMLPYSKESEAIGTLAAESGRRLREAFSKKED